MRHGLGAAGPGYELRADVDPPRVRVTVDAVGGDDQFISGLDTSLEILDPDHPDDKRETAMAQTAPGRYQGSFTLNRYGSYLLRALHRRGGAVVAESTGAFSLPYLREFLALPPADALLARVARTTQGRVQIMPAQAFDPGPQPVRHLHELRAWALWVAALLLLLDVAIRRLRLFGFRALPL
jgi:hypothetical protein